MITYILIGVTVFVLSTIFICFLMPDTNTPGEDDRQYKWCKEWNKAHKKKENGYISF